VASFNLEEYETAKQALEAAAALAPNNKAYQSWTAKCKAALDSDPLPDLLLSNDDIHEFWVVFWHLHADMLAPTCKTTSSAITASAGEEADVQNSSSLAPQHAAPTATAAAGLPSAPSLLRPWHSPTLFDSCTSATRHDPVSLSAPVATSRSFSKASFLVLAEADLAGVWCCRTSKSMR
jgi:hypothetical protein